MKNLLILSLLSLPIAFGACTAEAKKEPTTNEQPANEGGKKAMAEAAEYDVKCGCSIEGIGHCDPFIMIDGKYVPLVHPKVGKMEFCAQKDKGAKIEAVGAMKDGKFVAESWKLVE